MRKLLLISALACTSALTASAQADDMYFTPSKKAKKEAKAKFDERRAREAQELARIEEENDRIRTYVYNRMYGGFAYRDVDEYNRRGRYAPQNYAADSLGIITSDSIGNDTFVMQAGDSRYPDSLETDSMSLRDSEDYKYSRRMARFDDARPINIYVINNTYDPWYDDPWYYGWYGPHYRSRLYWNSWYGPGWAYYDPWYYDPWYYRPGWYGPGWCGPGWYGPGWYGPGWHGPSIVHVGGVSYNRGGTANRNSQYGNGRGGVQRGTGYRRGGVDRASSSTTRGYSGVQRSNGFSSESSSRSSYNSNSRSNGFSNGSNSFGGGHSGGSFGGGHSGGGFSGGHSGGGFGGRRR